MDKVSVTVCEVRNVLAGGPNSIKRCSVGIFCSNVQCTHMHTGDVTDITAKWFSHYSTDGKVVIM